MPTWEQKTEARHQIVNLKRALRNHLDWAEDQLHDADVPKGLWRTLVLHRDFTATPTEIGGPGFLIGREFQSKRPSGTDRALDRWFPRVRLDASVEANARAWRHEMLAAIAAAADRALASPSSQLRGDTCRAIEHQRRAIIRAEHRQKGRSNAAPRREEAAVQDEHLKLAVASVVKRGQKASIQTVLAELRRRPDGVGQRSRKTIKNRLSELRLLK
jgi:hypothetical protein